MNKNILTILMTAAAMIACVPDNEVMNSRERSVLEIEFEGQIGSARVEAIGSDGGTIDFQLAVDLIADMKAVEIKTLVISYNASANIRKGDRIDLSGEAPALVVTAQSGETRTYTLKMDKFRESFQGCYRVSTSWIVGGLGGADGFNWGTMELVEPSKKSWCWDKDGYGPGADYDNYFEVACTKINDDGSTEGTITLYSGEDGKNWNCIFNGEYNKEVEGQNLDLRGFYRGIPLGVSTWKRDYSLNTLTISDDKGNSHSATFLETGYHTVGYKGEEPRGFEVEDSGLAFSLKGDQTWSSDFLYTDYRKFAVSPLGYFLLYSKVDEIPSASRKPCDEGPIDLSAPEEPDPGIDPEPEDPDPEPGDDSFSGTYKVNSLKVLGGGGATAFVEVKAKSWMWNSSVNKEYDNLLVVDMTAGTLDYQAGEDGAWWDYVLVAGMNKLGTGDVDLSYNYGQLPHGESSFALSQGEEGEITITIDGSVNARVLEAGDHSLSAGWAYASGTVTVPEGSLGLCFDCTILPDSQYTWDEAWKYSDFERFYLRPFYYIMIFDKQ